MSHIKFIVNKNLQVKNPGTVKDRVISLCTVDSTVLTKSRKTAVFCHKLMKIYYKSKKYCELNCQ